MRRAKTPKEPAHGLGKVVVTGICGRLGKRVTRVLHRTRPVVGVDRRPFPDRPKDVQHEAIDVRRKKLKDIFRAGDVEAVVHLGIMHDPRASSAEHHSSQRRAYGRSKDRVGRNGSAAKSTSDSR